MSILLEFRDGGAILSTIVLSLVIQSSSKILYCLGTTNQIEFFDRKRIRLAATKNSIYTIFFLSHVVQFCFLDSFVEFW